MVLEKNTFSSKAISWLKREEEERCVCYVYLTG